MEYNRLFTPAAVYFAPHKSKIITTARSFRVKHRKGVKKMIKGVNRQVIEITQTKCEYFEKVLFFIKPEYAATSEGTLRERAEIIADSAGIPPASRLKKRKWLYAIKLLGAALAGAAVTAIISFLL